MSSNKPSETPSKQPMLNSQLLNAMKSSAGKLSLFVFICIVFLLLVRGFTVDKIAESERQKMLETFHQVLPHNLYDNDPLEDTRLVKNPALLQLLGSQQAVTLYRARKGIQPAGVIFQTIAPNGYSGNIYILIGILPNGQITGVRVLKHAETPGLGDKIETTKSDWIYEFDHKVLTPGNEVHWKVQKDGGDFDQFTGATITPRAVVNAVKNALEFVNQMGDKIYE